MDFVDALREELNFTVTWLNPENLLDWGDLDAEGEWTGSMRMVYDGTVDFKPEISCDYIKNQVEQLSFSNLPRFPKKVINSSRTLTKSQPLTDFNFHSLPEKDLPNLQILQGKKHIQLYLTIPFFKNFREQLLVLLFFCTSFLRKTCSILDMDYFCHIQVSPPIILKKCTLNEQKSIKARSSTTCTSTTAST